MTGNEEDYFFTVQKYPVIFDKSNNHFHCKDVKKNNWEGVAKKLGVGNGELCWEKIVGYKKSRTQKMSCNSWVCCKR